ncbi:DUF6708 domain-containing protein [Sphaerotilaceae bacterium SBD11-9]
MSTPVLLRHGQNIKPQYAAQSGQAQSWAGKSTAEERPEGDAVGIVKRFAKRRRASIRAVSLGLVSRANPNAIRYSIPAEVGLRGLALLTAVLGAAMFIPALIYFGKSAYDVTWLERFIVGGLLFIPFCYAFLVWLAIYAVRLELFRPIDEPTIFDRKHRKVYRIFCEAQPGLKGLFKPWPLRACEYEWDLIDVEHNARLVTTGSTVRRDSSLVFIVRKSADDPTIIDSFNIGNSLIFSLDETVAATYEHIRRFMEEGGPPLPDGESLPTPKPRKGFWARVWMATPFSPSYWRAWREELPMMLLAHVVFPVTIVVGGLWLFFNWLAVATSRPIEWPPEVVAAVGAEIAARQSAADHR